MADLIAGVTPGSETRTILPFVQSATKGDFCLMYDADSQELVAYNYYHHVRRLTPFDDKPLPVVHFGSAYKKPDLRGGSIIWRLGRHYARHLLGPFWYLKKIVGVTRTINPRVVEYFSELFPIVFPQADGVVPEKIHQFNAEHHWTNFKMEVLHDKCPYSIHPFTVPGMDFTEMWKRRYHSRDPKMNDYILDFEMVKAREGRFYQTDRLVHLVGLYDPVLLARKRFLSQNLAQVYDKYSLQSAKGPNLRELA